MNVKIRQAKNEEFQEIHELIFRIFPKADLEIKKNDLVFVAELGTGLRAGIVGFAHFSKKRGKIMLCGIGVAEGYRGRGIGRQLLDASLKNLGRDVPVYLKVKPTNDPAIALYVKSGFFQKKYGNVFMMVKLPEN